MVMSCNLNCLQFHALHLRNGRCVLQWMEEIVRKPKFQEYGNDCHSLALQVVQDYKSNGVLPIQLVAWNPGLSVLPVG